MRPAVSAPTAVGAPSVANPDFSTDVPWSDNGYSDSPIQSYASGPTADPDRLDNRTRVDSRANLRDILGWWKKNNADRTKREAVTSTDADGWTIRKGGSGRGAAPRPGNPGESRPTQQMGPSSYSFSRPFDATMERRFTGDHFSMADHRRTYEIFGMAPVSHARNTYRIEPGPTDRDITDKPADTSFVPQYAQTNDLPVASVERGWRI